MDFIRPQHTIIAQALASMDAALLSRCHCYFGGGTAIVLAHGEYRLSLDVDFLCADPEGYRILRNAAVRWGAKAFFGNAITSLRDVRTDQYGLRTLIAVDGQTIKFEIVRESRITLAGAFDPRLGVPVLSLEDQVAEKLLANADRCADRSVAYRDAIDLGYLVQSVGAIPSQAIAKAEAAYGEDITRKLQSVFRILASKTEVRLAADVFQMRYEDVLKAVQALRQAAQSAWPRLTFDQPAVAGSEP